MIQKPEVGATYRHFKSTTEKPVLYLVRGFVTHSETEEELVLYEARYGGDFGKLWVRPLVSWCGEVDRPEYAYKGPRFTKVEPKD